MHVDATHKDADAALARLKRFSHWLSWACRLAMVALLLPSVLTWAFYSGDAAMVDLGHGLQPVDSLDLRTWQRVFYEVVVVVPLALAMMALWHSQRCLQAFSRGFVFTQEVVYGLRAVSGWVAVGAVVDELLSVLVPVALSWYLPEGERMVAWSFGGKMPLVFVFAGLVWVMAEVIAQGQRLERENREFV